MEKKSFDKVIKKSLENLKADYNPTHWEELESLLNNLPVGDATDRDNYFDALIKNKIAGVKVPISIANWAGMEAALTAAETVDADFDNAIQEKIGDLQGVTPNWAGIEEILDIEEAADAQFDEEIYAKLRNIHPTYQRTHWQRLVAKMNANFALREKLYQYKLLEATLMILLLLNFYHYMPSNYSAVDKGIAQKNSATQNIETNPDSGIFEESMDTPLLPSESNNSTDSNLSKKKSEINSAKSTEESVQSIKPIVVENFATTNSTPSSTKSSSNEPSEKGTSGITSTSTKETINNQIIANNEAVIIKRYKFFVPELGLLNLKMEQRSGLNISMSEMNQHLAIHTDMGNNLIATIPSLKPNFVESQSIIPLGCKDCKRSRIPARLRLGLVANVALNNVYRAGGQILDISALNQKGFGYGSGISLGFKKGRWEIETGFTYSAKQYDPNIIEKHGGIVSNGGISQTHFKRIHLQTAHIPINFRYNYAVLGKGRWHLYTQAGGSLNVILRAEYDLAETKEQGRFQGVATTTSRLSLIDYNHGLLAGDGLKENKYLAISMGAGVERYMSPRWSIFLQPDFHFHFSGNRIGPNEDRINTLSLSFGARKSLY